MKISADIRHLYKHLQPTFKQSADNVIYSEFLPDLRVQDFIYCYWQLKTFTPLTEPFIYRVVADGCICIFFELNYSKDNFVMGFCKKFTEFPLDNSFHYIGVLFLPTMFPQLFRINASEISNRFEQLGKLVPKVSMFIEDNFHPQLTPEQIQIIFNSYFINLVENTTFDNDSRLYNAIKKLLQEFGVVNIEWDLDTGISQRRLRRLFEFYIGDTAKTFAKVVRFQNILRAKPSLQSLKENKLIFDVGYYDQAHFILEFKSFYDITPSKAYGR